MKSTFLFIILFYSNLVYSQIPNKGDIIILKTPTEVIRNKTIFINTPEHTDTTSHLASNVKFKVVKINEDNVELTALSFKNENSHYAKLYNDKIYNIERDNLTDNYIISQSIDKLSIGVLTIPFKYRPQKKSTYDTEFNLNTTLNIYIPSFKSITLYTQLGTGFGSVKLDNSNSTAENDKTISANTLNTFFGAMLQYKNVQFGIYSGTDIINNQNEYKWIHNGKLWFGFGIGYNLFKIGIQGEEKQSDKVKVPS